MSFQKKGGEMKSIGVILSIVFLSLNLSANDRLLNRVLRASDNINNKVQNNANRLSEHELRSVLENLRAIRGILSGRNPGNPPNRGNIDAIEILQAAHQSIKASYEAKSKAVNAGIVVLDIQQLDKMKRACDKTKTWRDNSNCLVSGLGNMRANYHVRTGLAKQLIKQSCKKATTWNDEASCFVSTIDASRSNQIYDATVFCQGVSGAESKSNCYREALN